MKSSSDALVIPVQLSPIPPGGHTPTPCLAQNGLPSHPTPAIFAVTVVAYVAFILFVPQSHSQQLLIPSSRRLTSVSFKIQAPLPLTSSWVKTVRGTVAHQREGDGVGYLPFSAPSPPWSQLWQWLSASRLLCLLRNNR